MTSETDEQNNFEPKPFEESEREHLITNNHNHLMPGKSSGSQSSNSSPFKIPIMSTKLNSKTSKEMANKYESKAPAYVRYFFLVSLCLQNASYTLLRRFAVGFSGSSEVPSPSSILIVGEIIKLTVSLVMTIRGPNLSQQFLGGTGKGGSPKIDVSSTTLAGKFEKIIRHGPKMAVPAIVYWIMNQLSFVALKRIDAGTFTVCAQLKTLTTALFSWMILGRTFSQTRIRSLVHLVCSVIVISEFAATHRTPASANKSLEDMDEEEMSNDAWVFLLGLGAVLTEVSLSGGISVFYEKVLKDDIQSSGLSVWDRNIQLAVISIAFYFPTFMVNGWFAHWSFLTFIIAFLGASGGLLVAFSMKFTDAILKALATSGAIVLSSALGALWLDGPFGIPIAVASISVVVSIYTYVTEK